MRNNKGFSVIEMIIVMAIIGMLAAFSVSTFQKFNSLQALNKDAGVIISALNYARSLTLSSKNNSQYGVHFGPTQMIIFPGNTYSFSESGNIPIKLNRFVTLGTSLNGGGNDVVFSKITGKTPQSGTITLSLKAVATSTKTITIFGTGVVESN